MQFKIVRNTLVAIGDFAKSRKGAIRNSLKSWQVVADYLEMTENDIPDKKADKTCNLCQLYPACKECPILQKTGRTQCDGTAYYKYVNAREDFDHAKALRAAHKMVDLLASLLDEPPAEKVTPA